MNIIIDMIVINRKF